MQRDIITKSLVFVALLSQLISIYLTTHYGTIPFYVPHIYTAFYGLEFLLFVYTKPDEHHLTPTRVSEDS